MSTPKVSSLIKSFQGFLKNMVSSNELTVNLIRRVEIMLFYLNRYPLDCDKMELYSMNSNSQDFQEIFIKDNQLDVLIFGIKEILSQKNVQPKQDLMQTSQNNQIPELIKTQNEDLIKNFINNMASGSTNKNTASQSNNLPNIEVTSFEQTYPQQHSQHVNIIENPLQVEFNKDGSLKAYHQQNKEANNANQSKFRNEQPQYSSTHIQVHRQSDLQGQNNQSRSADLSSGQEQKQISLSTFNPSIMQLDALINEVSNKLNENTEYSSLNKSNSQNALPVDSENHSNSSRNSQYEHVKHSKQQEKPFEQSIPSNEFAMKSEMNGFQGNQIQLLQQQQYQQNLEGISSQHNQGTQQRNLDQQKDNDNYNYLQHNKSSSPTSKITKVENKKINLTQLLQDVRSNIQIMKSHTQLYQDLIREYHDNNRQQLIQKHQDLAGKYQYKFNNYNSSEKQQHTQMDLKHSMKKSLKNVMLYTRQDSRNASFYQIENDLNQKLQQTKNNLVHGNGNEKRQYINVVPQDNSKNKGYLPGEQIESLSQRYMLNRQKLHAGSNDSTPLNKQNNQQNSQQPQQQNKHVRQYHQTAFIGTIEQQQQIQQYSQQIQQQEQQQQQQQTQQQSLFISQQQPPQQFQNYLQQQIPQLQQPQIPQIQQPQIPQMQQPQIAQIQQPLPQMSQQQMISIQSQDQNQFQQELPLQVQSIQGQLNIQQYMLPVQQSQQKSFERERSKFQTEIIRSPNKERKIDGQSKEQDSQNNLIANNNVDKNSLQNNSLIPPLKAKQNVYSSQDFSYQQPPQSNMERVQSRQMSQQVSPSKQLQNMYSLENVISQQNSNNPSNTYNPQSQEQSIQNQYQLQQSSSQRQLTDLNSLYGKEEMISPTLPKNNQKPNKLLDQFALHNISDKKHFYINDQKIY